jgi:hypothetical protein
VGEEERKERKRKG